MKTTALWSLLLVLVPATLFAVIDPNMSRYCSSPPFVTRSVAPNIMVLMDNSEDMMDPAHPGDYTPNATNSNYTGYFQPQECYRYSTTKFVKGVKNADGTCPSTAPFRGNLLNWATTSKYDILQKVLIGGNAVSKQGNAHTLVAIGRTFTNRTHDNCVFKYSNGNLTITETAPGVCGLLNSPPVANFALNPIRDFGEMFARGSALAFKAILGEVAGVGRVLLAVWSDVDLVSKAWASTLNPISVTGAANTQVGLQYSITFETGGDNNDIYYWSVTDLPAWMNATPTYASVGNKTNVQVTWTGTPTSAIPDTYTFSVTATHRDGTDSRTVPFTINIESEPLRIVTAALSDAQRDTAYAFSMTALGGAQFDNDLLHPDAGKHYHWSATGLPTGLDITQAGGTIYGNPSVNGEFTPTITVTSVSGQSVSKTYTLNVTSAPLYILTNSLPNATQGMEYMAWLQGVGGTAPYTWAVTSGVLPADIALDVPDSTTNFLWGTPTVTGSFPITLTITDAAGTTASRAYTLVVSASSGTELTIATNSPLANGVRNVDYFVDFIATGGTGAYTWAISGAPAGMTIDGFGRLEWTPGASQTGDYSFIVTVTDSASPAETFSGTYTLTILSGGLRQQNFAAKVDQFEEPFTDVNGNGIADIEPWDDTCAGCTTNGIWDGKKGVFQSFWDSNNVRARWGLTMFRDVGGSTIVNVANCIPASPASAFYTNLQNATSADNSPLASELYGAIEYFDFNAKLGFTGCTNSDPIDDVPCRKNFLLVISSGSDVTTGNFFADNAGSTDCAHDNPVVQNACYGFKEDLRTPLGNQNVRTYIVNTMGTDPAKNALLEEAALVGGGAYYDASDANDLEAKLINALDDILSQAASGTAVSVLTTSSRGIGSMMQAYFLPVRLEGEREVAWTGYAQNIWIDNTDNLREDSPTNDFQLKLDHDKIIRLFFDTANNQTKAARFTTQGLADCDPESIDDFDEVHYTWEGGKKLALKYPLSRKLFTSTKVIHGGSTIHDFTPTDPLGHFPVFGTSMGTTDAVLVDALDDDATYSAENIVRYMRGECLETGSIDNNPCGATANGIYRDRRVTVPGGGVNGNVWKLGDIINSTPKVLANTPVNTYHIDYGDSTYYNYVSDTAYKQRSAMTFIGANDGVLHAFRVGYLKDTGTLPTGVTALVKNDHGSNDSLHADVGEEAWGYIPFNAFPYLKYLASPDYCHMYFNDLSVRLVDASLGCPASEPACDEPAETRALHSWRTILIGGMRFGGCGGGATPPLPITGVGYSSYYAIDVTDAENPIPLWEFSDPDLGYATTFPSVIRTGNSTTNGNWYVVVGSGSTRMPKSGAFVTDIQRTTAGYVYFIDLKTGVLKKKAVLDHNAMVGDILGIDANKDYWTEKLYFGTTYDDAGVWKGKVMKIDIPNVALDNTWTPTITALFSDVFPFTASLDAAKDVDGNIWVYGGSGKYYSDEDEIDASNQIVFGLKDNASPSPAYPWSRTNLADQTAAQTTGTISGTQTVCGFDGTDFSSQNVVTSVSNPATTGSNTVTNGWYVTLTGGERVITRPLAVGGLVDFLTYAPSGDACSYGGNSKLYAFSYTTGLAPANVAIRSNATTAGETDIGDVATIARGVLLGPGAPPTGEAIIIPPPKEGQEQLKKKIQIATGVIVEAENTPVMSVISKIVHWLKK